MNLKCKEKKNKKKSSNWKNSLHLYSYINIIINIMIIVIIWFYLPAYFTHFNRSTSLMALPFPLLLLLFFELFTLHTIHIHTLHYTLCASWWFLLAKNTRLVPRQLLYIIAYFIILMVFSIIYMDEFDLISNIFYRVICLYICFYFTRLSNYFYLMF